MDEQSAVEKLAELMFNAYRDDADGVTWDGKNIPVWRSTNPQLKEIGEEVRGHWIAAAEAVVQLVSMHDDPYEHDLSRNFAWWEEHGYH